MQRRHLSLAGLLLLAVAGCTSSVGQKEPTRAPEARQGKVDKSLPKDAQARQKAVADVLTYLQEENPIYKIPNSLRGIEFAETEEQFFAGAPKLARWNFQGSPQGEEVPVVLQFATVNAARESDQAEKTVERTYVVKGLPGHFAITRK